MTKQKSDLMQLLSVSNLVPLMVTFISFIVFLVKMQSGNELLEYKIDQLSKKLDTYVESRQTASTKMTDQTNIRTAQISELQRYVQQCCNVTFKN